MRISPQTAQDGTITGYNLWLSANDTYNWAHRPGESWLCSTTSDHRLYVGCDSNGLCDLTVDGKYQDGIDGQELDALVADHLPKRYRHLWPVWAASKVIATH